MVPNSKDWDSHDGYHLVEMVDFEPMDAWKLVKNDLESMFVDYFWDEADVYEYRLENALVETQYKVSYKGFAPNSCKDN